MIFGLLKYVTITEAFGARKYVLFVKLGEKCTEKMLMIPCYNQYKLVT